MVGCGNACIGHLPKGSALANCYVIEASMSFDWHGKDDRGVIGRELGFDSGGDLGEDLRTEAYVSFAAVVVPAIVGVVFGKGWACSGVLGLGDWESALNSCVGRLSV